MNKICVYTCITGDYDNLKEVKYLEDNIDYICFTNNKKIKSSTWKIKYLDEGLDNWSLARKVKIMHHKYLEKYKLTIWIDGAMSILKPISQFLKQQCNLNKYDMITFKHQQRDCIYQEINVNALLYKENINKLKKIKDFLIKEKYPEHNGLIESSILVRKNISEINELMEEWYKILKKYSNRDQLSFNFALWKKKIKIHEINMYAQDNKYFKNNWHNKSLILNKSGRIYFGQIPKNENDFLIDNIYDFNYIDKDLTDGINIPIIKNSQIITIILKDEKYSKINNKIKINNCNTTYNTINFNNNEYFTGYPTIEVKLNKNTIKTIKLKLDISNSQIDDIAVSANNNIIALNNLNKKLQNDNIILNDRINKIYTEHDKALKEKSELKEVVNNLTQELNNIQNSTSWKVTKPLRKVSSIIKGNKK